MMGKKSFALGVAAVTAATLAATAVVGAGAAGATAPAGVPVITAHVGGGKIALSSGNTLHAGRIMFRVITGKGDHTLQVLRLHHGYTLQEAGADFGKAFSGNVAAVRRLDDNITFRGGAESRPNRPGAFAVTLRRGHFVFLDQTSNAVTMVNVVGSTPNRRGIVHQSMITAFSYGFESVPETIPANGTTYFFNRSDQPHFLVMQHVKEGVTRKMVDRAFSPSAHGNAPWVLRGSTDSGVISPNFGQMLHYDLPAGKYLIACFWPDDDTGMPHAFMGMWKLIHLR